jgi:hypothetical protein
MIARIAEIAYWSALAAVGLVAYACAVHKVHHTMDGLRAAASWFVGIVIVLILANIFRST